MQTQITDLIINFPFKYICSEKQEFIIADQLLKRVPVTITELGFVFQVNF